MQYMDVYIKHIINSNPRALVYKITRTRTYTYIYACMHIYKHTHTHIYTNTHTHTHTHNHSQSNNGKLVFQFIFPPNNSECSERLADKVHHTHKRQCSQYSASPIAIPCGKKQSRGFELQACDTVFYFRV
jgi:hypothetical protein